MCVCVCVCVCTIQVSDDCMSSSDEDEWKGFETSRSPSLPRVEVGSRASIHDGKVQYIRIVAHSVSSV